MSKEPEALKQEAEEYLENIKLYASHWGKALLIAGGTVYVSYKIIKGITTSQKKKKFKERALKRKQMALVAKKPGSKIARLIRQQIGLFLLAIIKQKLLEVIKKRNYLNGDKAV